MRHYFHAVLLALAPLLGFSQNHLKGRVTDQDFGHPLEQVSVYFPQLEKGTVTDKQGDYTLDNLPEGTYRLVVSHMGYRTHSTALTLGKGANHFDLALQTSAIEMAEIVLSTPFHKLQRENVMMVEQRSMAELNAHGAVTLAEGITQIPGVSSVSTGMGIGKPVIRGLGFNRVLVYTQGIRLENQQFGGEHGLGINEAGISSVEVIKGPASLLYGSDALGGVLYLNPEPFESPGETSAEINLDYHTNTLGMGADAGFRTSGEKFRFLVRGAHATHADYQTGQGNSVTNSRFRETDLKTGLAYQATRFKSELRYNFNHADLGIPEEISLQDNGRDPLLPNQEINTHILSSKNNFFFKRSSLEATLGYILNDRKEFEEHHHDHGEEGEDHGEEGEDHGDHGEEGQDHPALHMKLSTLNYNLQFNPQWGNWTTIFGLQGMRQENRNYGEEVLVPDAVTNDFGLLATSHIHFDHSDLQLGLRYDIRTIKGEENGVAGEEDHIGALDKTFNSLNAALGYRKDLTEEVLLRANLASGFRAPNLSELSSNGLHSGANRVEIGNAGLKSEHNFQIDLALEYNNRHFEAYVNSFYNHVDNFIYLRPTGAFRGADPIYEFGQQNAKLIGGELGFHLHPHPMDWLHLESSYDLVYGQLEDRSHLPLMPANRWTNTFRVEWNHPDKPSGGYAFVTVQTHFDQNKVAAHETKSPRYNLWNIGLGGEMVLFDQRIGYRVSGNNLFDKDYISHLSRLKPDGMANMGRNIALNLSIPL